MKNNMSCLSEHKDYTSLVADQRDFYECIPEDQWTVCLKIHGFS